MTALRKLLGNRKPKLNLGRFNPDSAVQLKGWKRGAILEQRRRPTLQLQSLFGLAQAVAIKLNIRSQHRRSMSASRHKPIDFAAEGLRLAIPVDRNCGIRVQAILRCVNTAVIVIEVHEKLELITVRSRYPSSNQKPD
jgi:hypothetical protein